MYQRHREVGVLPRVLLGCEILSLNYLLYEFYILVVDFRTTIHHAH